MPSDDLQDRPAYGPPAAEVAFADLARDFDQLLEKLVERVRTVQRTQSRLRGLLRASLEVARGVDLDDVLRHIVTAAKDLVDARYGALGVVHEGHLVRFVHAGLRPDQVASVGDLSRATGVLGVLMDISRPAQPTDLADDSGALDLPPDHPSTRAFLGVPIRVRDQVFGNLYLTGKLNGGEFSPDDEEVVCALAAAAGVAIENATLFAASRRARDWHAAMFNVATELLSGTDPDQALRYLVRQVCEASGADGAGFTTTTDDPDWLRTVVAVDLLARWEGEAVPTAGSLSGAVIAERRAILIHDLERDPRTAGRACRAPLGGAVIGAPVIGERGVRGVLLACRRKGAGTFASADLDMIATFAAQAALALELAEVRRDNERLTLLEDRQRIAGDLRETVIRELFSLGLSLQSISARTGDPRLRQAIGVKVDDLDHIIHDVRQAIFALDPVPSSDHTG